MRTGSHEILTLRLFCHADLGCGPLPDRGCAAANVQRETRKYALVLILVGTLTCYVYWLQLCEL